MKHMEIIKAALCTFYQWRPLVARVVATVIVKYIFLYLYIDVEEFSHSGGGCGGWVEWPQIKLFIEKMSLDGSTRGWARLILLRDVLVLIDFGGMEKIAAEEK